MSMASPDNRGTDDSPFMTKEQHYRDMLLIGSGLFFVFQTMMIRSDNSVLVIVNYALRDVLLGFIWFRAFFLYTREAMRRWVEKWNKTHLK